MWLVELTVKMKPDHGGDLRAFIDNAYADLRTLQGIADPDWSATLGDGTVSFYMVVPGDDSADARHAAQDVALGAVRSALHAAGGHTPEWDAQVEHVLSRSRLISEPAST